jgi:hypothetical protein
MRRPTILSVHNYYQQACGEDEALRGETALLTHNVHAVVKYEEQNELSSRRFRRPSSTGLLGVRSSGGTSLDAGERSVGIRRQVHSRSSHKMLITIYEMAIEHSERR